MIVQANVVLNRTVVDSALTIRQPMQWSSSKSKWVVSHQLMVLNSCYWPDWSTKSWCYLLSIIYAMMLLATKTWNVIGVFHNSVVFVLSYTVSKAARLDYASSLVSHATEECLASQWCHWIAKHVPLSLLWKHSSQTWKLVNKDIAATKNYW